MMMLLFSIPVSKSRRYWNEFRFDTVFTQQEQITRLIIKDDCDRLTLAQVLIQSLNNLWFTFIAPLTNSTLVAYSDYMTGIEKLMRQWNQSYFWLWQDHVVKAGVIDINLTSP